MICYYGGLHGGPLSASVARGEHMEHVQAYTMSGSGFGPELTLKSLKALLEPYQLSISGPDFLLARITAMDIDWTAEGSEPPNPAAIQKAREVLELSEVVQVEPAYVTASAEGGIAVCFKNDGRYADVECFNNGEVWALVSDRQSSASSWPLDSRRNIVSALLRISNELYPNA